jgi:hypothetical protein
VPVRNDAGRLRVGLESIRTASASTPSEIIVVDNGSTDGSASVARELGATVLERPEGAVSSLRNEGAAAASGSVLAFVDADNEIVPGWVEAALDLLGDEQVGAVGAPYSPPAAANWIQRTYDRLRDRPSGLREVKWLGSGNIAVRRRVFEMLGGFDTRLVTCEDVDLCGRIRAKGFRILSDSRMASVHHGDPSTLSAVFRGELWRGRDNVRVSLRSPVDPRSLASLALSGVTLSGLALLLVGPLAGRRAPLMLGAGLVMAGGPIVARATRLLRGDGSPPPTALQAILVASAYETGRALALVVRLRHRRPHTSPAHAHA